MEKRRTPWGWIVGAALILIWSIFPILWIISLSFKQPGEVVSGNPTFLPKHWTWSNYDYVFSIDLFTRALVNSIGISLIATFIGVVFATLVAYAIARLDFPGKRLILGFALAIAMFPVVSLVGPLFNLWANTGLYDTWPGLIIPYISFALPLALWTLSAFFREIPWEMVPAALAFFTGRSQFEAPTTYQAAAAVIVTIPVVVLVLLFQKRIVAGLTSG